MQIFEGEDIWAFDGIAWIVIPTNVGWKAKPPPGETGRVVGDNPMGKGLAKEAAERYPWLPGMYGEWCKMKYDRGEEIGVTFDLKSRIVLFPTKALNEKTPWASWKSRSTMDLVRRSAQQLNDILLPHKDAWPDAKPLKTNHCVIPTVGCGSGGLKEDDVVPVLHEVLDDRYTLFVQRLF